MDLAQVTLAQLRYAVAVHDTRNFRRAAASCHVSQSGLSMQIQKLEELLGVVLFDRGKKPILVTPEGSAAIAQMKTVLREMERLGQVVSEEGGLSGRFRLGVIPTLAPTVLPLFLKRFTKDYPQIELVIEELKTEEMIDRLYADTLDAGLASTPLGAAGLQEETLGAETMHAYLPTGDPLLRKSAIRQADLSLRQLWVMPEGHCFRGQVLAYCRAPQSKVPRPIHFESGSFQALIRLVDEGLGATVLPALVNAALPAHIRKARSRPLVEPTPVREIGLVTSRVALRRKVSSALAEGIRLALSKALEPTPKGAVVLSPLDGG